MIFRRELVNLYYATSLFNTDFATKDTDDLTQGSTNLYYATSLFNIDFSAKTTDDLTEGATNLYFTNARASSAAPVQSVNGATGTVVLTTTNISEGTNLYLHKCESRCENCVG